MFSIGSRAIKLVFSRPARALLFLRLAAWVAFFSCTVRLFPLPRALHWVSVSGEGRPLALGEDQFELVSAVDTLLALNVFVFKPICWKRAAILHRYLGLRGINSKICFGLRKGDGGALNGHAWLESGGRPVFETETPNYIVTYVFPSNATFDIELASLAGNASRFD